MTSKEAIEKLTDAAQAMGATANDDDGKVRALVTAQGLGFNAWFCVCCELANRRARDLGFENEVDRAYTCAKSTL